MADDQDARRPPRRRVGYVLKGYPRISELFIASEIWRLEQLGLRLRLFVLKPADEAEHHPVVDRIEATPSTCRRPRRCPAYAVGQWLRDNFASFRPALRRVAPPPPAADAARRGRGARPGGPGPGGLRPRSIYLKEFLQAADVADRLLRAPATSAPARALRPRHDHGDLARRRC